MDISQSAGQARLGAVFATLVGCLVIAVTASLPLPSHQLQICAAIGATDVVMGALSLALPWDAMPRRGLLIFPLLMIGTVIALALTTVTAAEPFLALLTLSVLYVGLTQRRGTTLRILPLVVGAWWSAYSTLGPAMVMPRLALAVTVWISVGELLALYRAQEHERVTVLATAAETDPLTGLANRRRLDRSLAAATEDVTVLYLDLDHFKLFNDEHGHGAGDDLLQEFGAVLRASVRGDDLAVRIGGEEFMVLTHGSADGSQLDSRIRSAWHEVAPTVTYSSGVASQRDGERTGATMRRADHALYLAKARGRNMLVADNASEPVATAAPPTESLPPLPLVPRQRGSQDAPDNHPFRHRLRRVG
jgi:diguanylate cyclase (GGDEF)-like protein